MTAPAAESAEPGAGEPPPAPTTWAIRNGVLRLDAPLVMGILNLTPDSFSDGGRYQGAERALRRAEEMLHEGAALVDVGGESTRPGAAPVPVAEEVARVVPVVELLKSRLGATISVDTRRAEVARAALDAGADIINDITGLRDPEMAPVVAAAGAGLVVMHMRGEPQTMQRDTEYDDVVAEVAAVLRSAVQRAVRAGVPAERVAVDPGIGFAKTTAHNLRLIGRLRELTVLGRPVLLGPSRKAFLGNLLGGIPPQQRAVGTAAACVVGLLHGARIFRVHDVKTAHQALVVAAALRSAGGG